MTEGSPAFTLLDWSVLVAYLVGITAFGLWMARRVKGSAGFFLGDRKLPWWIMIGQSFSTGTHAENPVAQTGACFSLGFSTIWYQWKNMLITPFYWLMAPWYRRSDRTTVAEIIEDRYGRGMGLLYTVFAIAYFIFVQGAMLKGAGKMISVATGDMISPNGVVIAMTAAFILYSFFGGLIASAYADFIQGFLIIVLSFLLIPLGLRAIGGFTELHATLDPGYFVLMSAESGMGAFTIAMLMLNGIIGITAQPHMVAMNAAGSTERAGRVGMTYGAMVKRFCTIGWALTGLIVGAMVIQRGEILADPEFAFGYAARNLLAPGFVGLMIACILAANMSSCSTFMVNTGALFTRNLYVKYLNPDAGDQRLLWMGRFSGLALTLLGVLFGLVVDEVLHAFLFTETIAAFMGIMFIGGLLWKRANRQGALAATVAVFVVYYGVNIVETGTLQLVYRWLPAPFGWAMLAGFAALIVVSLLTRPEAAGKTDAFFEKMRRSSDATDQLQPGVGRIAAESGKELIMLDAPGWFKRSRWTGWWTRYREDLIGFVLAWGTVGFLVFVTMLLMRVGA